MRISSQVWRELRLPFGPSSAGLGQVCGVLMASMWWVTTERQPAAELAGLSVSLCHCTRGPGRRPGVPV